MQVGKRAKQKRIKYFLTKFPAHYDESFESKEMISDSDSDSDSSEPEIEELSFLNEKTELDLGFLPKKKMFNKTDPNQRIKQWEFIVNHWYDDNAESSKKLKTWIEELIIIGIPDGVRARMWCLLASSRDLLRKNEGLYDACLKSPPNCFFPLIDDDVKRTLPEHKIISTTEGKQNLTNILRGYSIFNPAVGYCQGMSFIAGYLYCHIKSPELSFWTFVSIMQQVRGLFADGLPLLFSSLDIFEKLIHNFLPTLAAHFAKQKFILAPVVSHWCSTLFCSDGVPFKVSSHVLDLFLYYGYEIIFRVGIAILLEGQSTLLKLRNDEIQQFLQKLPTALVSSPTLFQRAMGLNISAEISQLIKEMTS